MSDFAAVERWCELQVLMSGKPQRTLVCKRTQKVGSWKSGGNEYAWGVPEGTRCVLVPRLKERRIFPGAYVDESHAEELAAEDPDTWVIE